MKFRHIPNILTGLRFLLVIPILIALLQQHYLLALCLFILAGLTDGLDGLLARLCGWTSRFGAIADPLADKLLLMSSFLAFSWLGYIPVWIAVLVVFRDVWIVGGALAYRYCIRQPHLMPTAISKINTFLQLLLVALLLVHLSLHILPMTLIEWVIGAVVVTSIISFLHYTWVWGRRAALALRRQSLRGHA